ncbi:MAG: coat protein/nuclear export [Cressdnaviricota sp.]|nr:MAG: coat protein/nuclear export [Cressdnaviricota sp.]
MPKRSREDAPVKGPKFGKKMRTSPAKSTHRVKHGELKGVDVLLTQTAIVATTNDSSNSVVLNLVPSGATSYNRVGKKIYNQSVRLKGVAIHQVGATTTTSNTLYTPLRMVVVWDKQPSSGAVPNWDAIFGYTPQNGTEASTVLSPPRYDNMDRFTVLRDIELEPKSIATPFAGVGGTELDGYFYVPFDEYIKLNGRETVFSGQTAAMTIADVSTGALYVYFRALVNAAGTSVWTVDSSSVARLRYTD